MISIGVDIGGSTSRLLALRVGEAEDGFTCAVVDCVTTCGVAAAEDRVDVALPALTAALMKLLEKCGHEQVGAITVNLGGANCRQVKQALSLDDVGVVVYRESEGEIPLYLARLYDCRMAVLAGTGSIALGVDKENRRYVAGGFGYKLGDGGSGYWIGRQALAHLLHAYDGKQPWRELFHLPDNVPDPRLLKPAYSLQELVRARTAARQWIESLRREEVARFCREVHARAMHGNEAAIAILRDAGRELGFLAKGLAKRLALAGKARALIIGGLTSIWPFLAPGFAEATAVDEKDDAQPVIEPVCLESGYSLVAAAALYAARSQAADALGAAVRYVLQVMMEMDYDRA
jgi:N-acetylglucosamine kinase-like BadF-type ATPase